MLMKKYFSVIFIFVLIVSSLGCINGPEPPGADIPRLIVDYDQSLNNETIIHLRGMEVIRYENMTLNLNNSEIIKRDGYSIEHRTNLTEFYLEVNATRKENRYHFNATFEVEPEVPEEDFNEDIIFKITYYDGEEEFLAEDDLPFIRILNLVEEEEEET